MDEDSLISLAIERAQRSRYRTRLGNPKKRHRLLDNLNHGPPLDPRWTTWYSSFTKALHDVNVSATAEVYLLSAAPALDGGRMPYGEAINAVPMAGWGTSIGITPTLALYYGEVGEKAAVIRKET